MPAARVHRVPEGENSRPLALAQQASCCGFPSSFAQDEIWLPSSLAVRCSGGCDLDQLRTKAHLQALKKQPPTRRLCLQTAGMGLNAQSRLSVGGLLLFGTTTSLLAKIGELLPPELLCSKLC